MSRDFYENKLNRSRGFVKLTFLRNILDPEYVDVVTEWRTQADFLRFIDKNAEQPAFRIPYQVLERYLYETIVK